jgi:hypothetical protein
VGYVTEHVGCQHDVEGLLGDRQSLRVTDHQCAGSATAGLEHPDRQVEADDATGTTPQRRFVGAATPADIDDRFGAGPINVVEDPLLE